MGRKEPKKARQEEVDALLEEQQQTDQPRMETAKTVDVPAAKFAQFQDLLNQAFQSGHVQQMTFDEVIDKVNAGLLPSEKYNENETKTCLQKMEAENKIMCADDVVFLI